MFPSVIALAKTSRADPGGEDVLKRTLAVLDWCASRDVVTSPTESELRAFVESRCAENALRLPFHKHLASVLFGTDGDRAAATRDLAFAWLVENDCACWYDPEMRSMYSDYQTEILPRYIAIADGAPDELTCDVSGDYMAGEPAHLTLTLEGQQYEAEMGAYGKYVDFDGLHTLLNRVLADTSARRRFYHPWMGEASGAFLPPWAAAEVQAFFKRTC